MGGPGRRSCCALLALAGSVLAAAPSRAQPVAVGDVLDALAEGGARVQFRIDGIEVDPRDPDREIRLYAVSARNATGGWENACKPDQDGVAKAIPLAGAWDASGAHVDDARATTLACTYGVLAKCVRWGYKPWKRVNGRSLRDYHQACTRMARADYCGNGGANTRDGTWIEMGDRLSIQKPDLHPGQPLRFEAGWSPDGATYVNWPRWTDALDAIIRQCPEKLAGRTSRDLALDESSLPLRFPETLTWNQHFVRPADRLSRAAATPPAKP